MEKRTMIQWKDTGKIVEVVLSIGQYELDGYNEADDERIAYYLEPEQYKAGYTNGEFTIIKTADDLSVEPKWHTSRPLSILNDEEVVIGTDWCGLRADFNLARVQFIMLYNGVVEPYYHISFDEAWCYSVAAKELLSDSSYKQIYVPGGAGQTIVWLPIHRVQ